MKQFLVNLSLRHPRWVIGVCILLTIAAGVQFPRIHIDTDPENMLPADEPVRVFHDQVKETFGLSDFLVVGVVRETGVFTPDVLGRVAELTARIRKMDGVVVDDILAPTEVDDILPAEGGGIRVQTLMETPPETAEEAKQVLLQIQENPILRGKLASSDGQALALFIPLESKDRARKVASEIEGLLKEKKGDERYYLAGLPLAEDTFGAEMFQQMAVAAPLAFLTIFLLMLFFFRRAKVVLAPMLLAMMSVIWTMGLLIGLGYTVHIMSSMIPIFLIPIAVLDSIHVLSEVHDHYRGSGDMAATFRKVLADLFTPMLFIWLTTVVGFAALAVAPIPPVQVFGLFVAFGVSAAWLLTMTFLPAYTVLLPSRALSGFGRAPDGSGPAFRHLQGLLRFSLRFRAPILAGLVLVLALSAWGITRVQVNDNPVKWFRKSHPVRAADEVLNRHLAGTYLTHLVLEGGEPGAFLDPAWMGYVERLQARLADEENVGGTTSVADVIKKIHFELLDRDPAARTLPPTREGNAQHLLLYEMSGGSPDDLWKFITTDQDQVNIWVQMRRGENREVSRVVTAAGQWMNENPPPAGMKAGWAGLSYINVVWQQKMVVGMGKADIISFATVLLMMVFLLRSLSLGLISMIPLTFTIAMTYGFIGWSGRPYDMPVAVLSSLSMGLAVDFAIHFLERSRQFFRNAGGSLEAALSQFFRGPAEALVRNILVISIGFVPMFFSNLVPYVTVGAFFVSIMAISGVTTLVALPALLSYLPRRALAGGAARLENLEPSRSSDPAIVR